MCVLGRVDVVLCWVVLLVLQMATCWCRALPWPNGNTHEEHKSLRKDTGLHTSSTPEDNMVTGLEAEVQKLSMAVQHTYEELENLRDMVESGGQGRKHGHRHGLPKVTCRSAYTLWHGAVGKTLDYLDSFDVHCRHGEFLRQWRMTWGEREDGKKQIRFVCCKFERSSKEEKSHRRKSDGS